MPRRWSIAVFLLVTSFCVFLLSMNAAAQVSSPKKVDHSGEAAIFQRIFNRARFENDGTSVEETEAVVLIQSEAGVREFGQLVFGYSSATEKLEIEYVRVRKPDGQVIVTPESTAQDFAPDFLKDAPMYTDYRQRHISVAALRPGDTLKTPKHTPDIKEKGDRRIYTWVVKDIEPERDKVEADEEDEAIGPDVQL